MYANFMPQEYLSKVTPPTSASAAVEVPNIPEEDLEAPLKVYHGQADVRSRGRCNVSVYESGDNDGSALVVRDIQGGRIVFEESSDFHLFDKYQRLDGRTITITPVNSSIISQRNVPFSLTFDSEDEANRCAETIFSRWRMRMSANTREGEFEGRLLMGNLYRSPKFCCWCEKLSGTLKTWNRRWLMYEPGYVLSYWDDPNESMPQGVIDCKDMKSFSKDSSDDTIVDIIVSSLDVGNGKERVYRFRCSSVDERDFIYDSFYSGISTTRDTSLIWRGSGQVIADSQSVDHSNNISADSGAGVPVFIRECVEYLRPKISTSLCEEIFKKAGGHAELNAMRAAIDAGEDMTGVLYKINNVYACASLLKRFLLQLPEPVCTEKCYLEFVAAANVAELGLNVTEQLKFIASTLPETNKRLLRYIFNFLYQVTKCHDVNKMDARQLSLVLANALLRNDTLSAQEMRAHQLSVFKCVELMIQDTPTILGEKKFQNRARNVINLARFIHSTKDSVSDTKESNNKTQFDTSLVTEGLADKIGSREEILKFMSHRDQLGKLWDASNGDIAVALTKSGALLGLGDALLDVLSMMAELDMIGITIKTNRDMFLDVVGKWLELRAVFEVFDVDHDGVITMVELGHSMEEVGGFWGYKPNLMQSLRLFHELDVDESFGISWMEFRSLMMRWFRELKNRGVDISAHKASVPARRKKLGSNPQSQKISAPPAQAVAALLLEDDVTVRLLKEVYDKLLASSSAKGGSSSGIDTLDLGTQLREICGQWDLGGTLSEMFKSFKALEVNGIVMWTDFINVMGKWIALKRSFEKGSAGGSTDHSKKHYLSVEAVRTNVLPRVRAAWGQFFASPIGDSPLEDIGKMMQSIHRKSVDSNQKYVTFEEFMVGLRPSLNLKVVFEKYDTNGDGVLSVEELGQAMSCIEKLWNFPATYCQAVTLFEKLDVDHSGDVSWNEFVAVASLFNEDVK